MTHSERKKTIESIVRHLDFIMKNMKKKKDDASEPFCINRSQWLVLDLIENNEQTSIKAISEQLEVSSSAITQLVDDLVSKKYVIRKEDPNDRRSVQLSLSKEGKKQLKLMKKTRLKKMEQLFSPLNPSELKSYLKIHEKLALGLLEGKGIKV